MEPWKIHPISESDIDGVVVAAGGHRAHPDSDTRKELNADYLLNEAVIEYKGLDDEGLSKPERQGKLAGLFRPHFPDRPVIVLDKNALPADVKRDYDKILVGPVKGAVDKAKKQLKQSRQEHSVSTTILLVINNGYTALDHTQLVKLVADRARQDTEEIDGVVVGGCYFYGDGFDFFAFWPLEYVPIRVDRPFTSFPQLQKAWNAFTDEYMDKMMKGLLPLHPVKGPVVDLQFDVEGVTYVKLSPPVGKESGYFPGERPRKPGPFEKCPIVGSTFAAMTLEEWRKFRDALPHDLSLGKDYAHWRELQSEGMKTGTPLKPFVAVPVTHEGWAGWCWANGQAGTAATMRNYANEVFSQRVRALVLNARERTQTGLRPPRYTLAVTEVIGQNALNDVSHIAVVKEVPHSEPLIRPLVTNARIRHEHALALSAAYAVAEGIDFVLWEKELRYAWL